MKCLKHRTVAVVLAAVLGSVTAASCTANEAQQDLAVNKSSAVDTTLMAGIEAVNSDEQQSLPTSLVFTVENVTTEDQEFLVWNTPFESSLSADIFVVRLNDKAQEYQGRLVKRGSPLPEHFQTIKAGERLETMVDLASYYDMSAPGTYTVELDASIVDGSRPLNDQAAISFSASASVLTLIVP